MGKVLFTQHSSKYERIENENKPIIARVSFKLVKYWKLSASKDERLYIESIELGDLNRDRLSGLGKFYTDSIVVNKKVIVFANLKYSKFKV